MIVYLRALRLHGQYIPAWQLHEGALKPRDLRSLLDSLPGPRLLGMEDAG